MIKFFSHDYWYKSGPKKIYDMLIKTRSVQKSKLNSGLKIKIITKFKAWPQKNINSSSGCNFIELQNFVGKNARPEFMGNEFSSDTTSESLEQAAKLNAMVSVVTKALQENNRVSSATLLRNKG